MLYKTSKISKTKTITDPTNRNQGVYYFNNLNTFENNKRNALFGGPTDISGGSIFIKTRNKNVNDSIVGHITYTNTSGTVSASNEITNYEAWKAFNVSLQNWRSDNLINSTLDYTFVSNKIITGYMIKGDSVQNDASPKTWMLKAWNTNTEEWDTLDSQTNQPLSSGLPFFYSFVNETPYNIYRFEFTENCGNVEFIGVNSIQLFTGDTSIQPNEIIVEATNEDPLYFYRYLGTDDRNIEQCAVYTFTGTKKFTNTFNSAFTILYAEFDNIRNNFVIKYDTYNNINANYTFDQQQNDLISLATFQTSSDGSVNIPNYNNAIRNPDDVYFTLFEPLKTNRTYYSTAVCNNQIYVMGGSLVLAWNEAYTPFTNIWTSKTNIAAGRHYSTAQAIDTNVYYITGGASASTALLWNNEYDTIGDSWLNKTNIPVGVRESASTLVENNLIYVCGGTTASATYLMWHREWDKTNDVWTAKTNLPTIRGRHTYSNVANNLYAIGHQTLATTVINDMYSYVDMTWTSKTNRPRTGIGPSANVYSSKIYISGVTTITDVYDPSLDSWSTLENNLHINKVIGTDIVLHNNIMYYFDSTVATRCYPVYEGANFISNWSITTPIPSATQYTSTATHGKDIYVMFGQNDANNIQYNTISDSWSFKTAVTSRLLTTYGSASGPNAPQINSTIFNIPNYNIMSLYHIYTNNYIYKYFVISTPHASTIGTDLANNIYLFYTLDKVYKYEIETDTHTNKFTHNINMQTASCVGISMKNDIYLFGERNLINLNNCYHTFTDTIESKSSLVFSSSGVYRWAPASGSQNTIYYNKNNAMYMYTYNTITDAHNSSAIYSGPVKANPSTAILNNNFYILSGNNVDTQAFNMK